MIERILLTIVMQGRRIDAYFVTPEKIAALLDDPGLGRCLRALSEEPTDVSDADVAALFSKGLGVRAAVTRGDAAPLARRSKLWKKAYLAVLPVVAERRSGHAGLIARAAREIADHTVSEAGENRGQWCRATHTTRGGDWDVREAADGTFDIRERGEHQHSELGVSAAYVRAEFRLRDEEQP